MPLLTYYLHFELQDSILEIVSVKDSFDKLLVQAHKFRILDSSVYAPNKMKDLICLLGQLYVCLNGVHQLSLINYITILHICLYIKGWYF